MKILNEFTEFPVRGRLLTLTEMGSTSHGTHGQIIDDYDYMGIVVPPVEYYLGIHSWEHWVRPPVKDGYDLVLYSLRKYVGLALKNNPNVLGLLWTLPVHRLVVHPLWQLFIDNRDMFSSKKAYHSFSGYAHTQLEKMEHGAYRGFMGEKRKAMVQKFGFDCKNGAHLIRLLRMGIEFLKTGQLEVYRTDREELKAIKRGEWSLEKVKIEAKRLFAEASQAHEDSILPEEPDYQKAETLLIYVTKEML